MAWNYNQEYTGAQKGKRVILATLPSIIAGVN